MSHVEQKDAKGVLDLVQKAGIEMVDIRFCDVPGLMHHFSMTPEGLTEETFEEGFGFDGSSIRGFQKIHESDMILFPDPSTAFLDPFLKTPTLVINCFIGDPVTGESYSRDPRFVAKKAEDYLASSGIATHSFWGPEAEFYMFDDVRFDQTQNSGYYFLDSVEGIWNSGAEIEGGNKGYKPRHKEGYFPVPPMDQYQDLRSEMVLNLRKVGINVEVHHHEVGTAGQSEIDLGYGPLLKMADALMLYKYVVKSTAMAHGKSVTFMPKPIFQDNGSGMHVHQSLWNDSEPLFYGEEYANLSTMALHYIGGILKHAPALLAFCAPTTNSYKRLVPGFEAPVNLVYSQRNRSAAVRIPLYSKSPKSKRIEFRCPDPSCNPYFAFAAMLMAGLDGIKNGIEPIEPVNRDMFEHDEGGAGVPMVPSTLEGALDALEEDHDFLLTGGVFTEDLIETWLEYKRDNEVQALNTRPHPYEFHMYYDI
ncbi:MAG: type I glutamate--ammonia ligase [Actinobacteria bacterium]|nr:type I glutamate--ammonia ligase [Actinomycetota bacterium]